MRLTTKWWLMSVGGAVLVTTSSLMLVDVFEPPGDIAKIVLWPVSVCLYLAGDGPRIGTMGYEWTPVHDFAVAAGIGGAWAFYSSLAFLIFHFGFRRRKLRKG